jgi:hypothetical protein
VVWSEDFEEGSVSGVTARYDDFKNAAGMALVADVPPGSAGAASMRLTAGGSASTTDLYKAAVARGEKLEPRREGDLRSAASQARLPRDGPRAIA